MRLLSRGTIELTSHQTVWDDDTHVEQAASAPPPVLPGLLLVRASQVVSAEETHARDLLRLLER